MKHYEGTFKGVGDKELFYQRWQPDGAPKAVLVIIHGLGEHSGRYPNVVARVVPAGYAVYAYDQRGHGRTSGPRAYVNAWTELRGDVQAFLELVRREEPGRPVFLMGHSFGGLVALEFVLRHPEGLRGVIASAPGLSSEGLSPFAIFLGRILSRIWPTFSLKTGLEAAGISRDPAVVEAYVNDPLVHAVGTARLTTEALDAITWTLGHAAELRVPLLLLYGTADRIVPPQASRAFFDTVALEDKELREYDGFYHECHNDVGHAEPVGDLLSWLEQRV
ncbi:MAG: lysophospholipase [Anaerolineae bacterium]|nr:lysophospholipase [Anaerolineae bacterium]